jgi:hypothetical protein
MRDKAFFRNTILSLEAEKLNFSREAYIDYLKGTAWDAGEPSDHDGASHRSSDAELAEGFECPLHTHTEALAKLQRIDFGPKSEVEEGALVRFGGQWFVIAVSTAEFACDGVNYIGISTQAPIYNAMAGKRAGEIFEFRGRHISIEDVA